jgi:hypothetical protein
MRMWIRSRDPGIFFTRDPGWKNFGSKIRDKHPGSATQVFRVGYIPEVMYCNTVL